MKKLTTVLLLIITLFLFGCTKDVTASEAYDSFKEKITDAKSYELSGEMKVLKSSGEIIFDMEICYEAPENYKVTYVNKANNSRQILLKNSNGVYVLSPELNKEFKFESSWPLNSSHIYIINKVLIDLENDASREILETDDNYIFKSAISHKIKSELICQKVYLNKKTLDIEKITYNSEEKEEIIFTINSIEYDKSFDSNAFNQEAIMESETSLIGDGSLVIVNEILVNSVIEDVSLATTSTHEGITILTFDGAKKFVVIHSNIIETEVSAILRVYDDFVLLDQTVGMVSDSCLTFYLGNKEIRILSDALTLEEMAMIANSIEMN